MPTMVTDWESRGRPWLRTHPFTHREDPVLGEGEGTGRFRKLNVLHSPGTFLSNIQPRETKTCSQKPSQECPYGMDGGMLTPWNTNYSVIKRNGQ